MNKVVLIGRLTADPEMKFTPNEGKAVTTISLAVDRRIKKEGQPAADFIRCISFGKTAEIMAQYLGKGKLISVSGNLRTGSYEAKDGTKRYTCDVYIDEFQFLEKGSKTNNPDDMTPVDDGYDPFNQA
jgi:single-strand DNA-binding protein